MNPMPPRVLLLTHVPPGERGGGGVYFDSLCRLYPRDRICCVTVTSPSNCRVGDDAQWLPTHFIARPVVPAITAPDEDAGRAKQEAWLKHFDEVQVPAIVAEAVAFARQHAVERVWALLNAPFLFRVAKLVAEALGVPLSASVCDPPEKNLPAPGSADLIRRRLLEDFESSMRFAKRSSVMCAPMAAAYAHLLTTEPITLPQGIEPPARRRRARTSLPADGLRIGFAGSFYASTEWSALLQALDRENWLIDGRQVSIVCLTKDPPPGVSSGRPVHWMGWQTLEATLAALAEVDIAYLPYWFDPIHATTVRLSFPSKLSAYAATGTPVWFHGPEVSSVAAYFADHPMGLVCSSMEADDIIASLRRFVDDPAFYSAAVAAAHAAFDADFNAARFRQRFAALLGFEWQTEHA